jgi:hypothetical protein
MLDSKLATKLVLPVELFKSFDRVRQFGLLFKPRTSAIVIFVLLFIVVVFVIIVVVGRNKLDSSG